MASVYERITNALSSLGKRRERDKDSSAADGGRNGAAGTARENKRFQPWEQSDLHKRLESYKSLTWFAKPDSVGPVPCALKGWVNHGCDTLTCEHCGAKLMYPSKVPYEQRQAAADMFYPGLVDKHTDSCPWRKTQCNDKLLAYVPHNSNDEMCTLFQNLQNKLLKVDVLPDLDAIAIQAVRKASFPYGSYDDVVLGGAGGGALMPRRRLMPRVRITEGSGTDTGSEEPEGRTPSGPLANPSASETYIIQPSKLTPQQKARLLALLGWDVEVLQPDSASGSVAAPYTQSSSYSLAHLGVKPKKTPGGSSSAGSGQAAVDDTGKYPMSSVVLKCPRCNGRMGLWNFAGVRPVPSGRLTPGQPAEGATALLSPQVTAAAGCPGGAAADPLSVTIAGGQYGLHCFGGGGFGAKPFGSGAPPFKFGSGSDSSAPVFGMAALDAQSLLGSGLAGAGPSSTPALGFGSQTPKPLKAPPAATTPAAVTPVASAAAAAARPAPLTGQKRKASEPSVSDPMAMDTDALVRQTPGPGAAGQDGKRQRQVSAAGMSTPAAATAPAAAGATPMVPGPSPYGGRTPAASAGDTQLRQLDPVTQHRSWCPWVYTGTPEQQHMSGWQHMLQALSSQQQAPAAMAMEELPPAGAPPPPAAADPRALRDSALASIRSL